MELLKDEILYSKEIIENVFLFHNIYKKYLSNNSDTLEMGNRKEPNFFPPSDELIPSIPSNIMEKLNSLIDVISKNWELLNKSEQFQKVYKNHYNEKEELLYWTFGKNGIEQLLPVSVYIFIKKCQLKCDNLQEVSSLFSKVCNNYS